jgi:hypothetical protein
LKGKQLRKEDIRKVEELYQKRFGSKLECPVDTTSKTPINSGESLSIKDDMTSMRSQNLFMKIEKDNPVFLKEFCFSVKEIVIMTNKPNNKGVVEAFKVMQSNYKTNIKAIDNLIDRLIIVKKGPSYELRDITKYELDNIVNDVKSCIKLFYIQSIIDYQHLLDMAKNIQTIEINKE